MDGAVDSTGDFYSATQITDPSKSTDEEHMRFLDNIRRVTWRRWADRLEDLARWRPEQLPRCFLTDLRFSEGWQTDHGKWVPKKTVSSVGDMLGGDMLGVKTTLEFKPNKGIKVDIGNMAVYTKLVPHRDGLFQDESLSLCCVFPKGKGPAPDPCRGFVPPPLDEWSEDIRENFDATKYYPLGVEDYGVGDPKKRKRGCGSELWEGYTKIYTKDPDRMYAACNHCTTMLKIKPSGGTGSQRHHNNTCLFKKLLTVNSMNTPVDWVGLSGISEIPLLHP